MRIILCFMESTLFCSFVFTKPASINVGPPSARQRNAILMAFRWRADGILMAFRRRADGGPLYFVNWVGAAVIIWLINI